MAEAVPGNVSLEADHVAAIKQIQEFLSAKDDTSRFVGLALLKSVLDTQPQIREDSSQVSSLWSAISPKFLNRLLRARRNSKIVKNEARSMVDLAVAILHTFSLLLPLEVRKAGICMGKTQPLLDALIDSTPKTTGLILQTLLVITSDPSGALELVKCKDTSPLIEIAPQQALCLEILGQALTNAATESSNVRLVEEKLNASISSLLVVFRGTDSVTLLSFVGDTLPRLSPESLPSEPLWIARIAGLLQESATNRPTSLSRAAYTKCAATLIRCYPIQAPKFLFTDRSDRSVDTKPSSYLLINLLLIDIRSSLPDLLSKLNNGEYPSISARLSAAYDVLSSFTSYLVRCLETIDGMPNVPALDMAPDLLLNLRKNVSETMSLTIEFLRDRWDASIAGVSGLHPSVRSGTSSTSNGTRLTLAWESMTDDIRADNLVLAAMRSLAIWLKEDDNDSLKSEAAGLMDMFLELYPRCPDPNLDFRFPILMTLEGILNVEAALEAFQMQNGWNTVAKDLMELCRPDSSCNRSNTSSMGASVTRSLRGLGCVRVLLLVVDSDPTTEPRSDWMRIVDVVASTSHANGSTEEEEVEFQIAQLQLSVALLEKASQRVRRQYATHQHRLVDLCQQLDVKLHMVRSGGIVEDFRNALNDVLLGLENLETPL